MKNALIVILAGMVFILGSCSNRISSSLGTNPFTTLASAKDSLKTRPFKPLVKYGPEKLRADFDFMRKALERFHPSLYWYTPKDSMDMIFDLFRAAITDSMTEQQFGFRIVAPVTTAIRCGHTSFSYSKKYNREMKGIRLPSFPLLVKVWGDSMIVTGNLNKRDSIVKRGMVVNSIDGMPVNMITNIMFRFLPKDGYSESINYIRLSNAFPYYHRNIFGLKKTYAVTLTDSAGQTRTLELPVFDPMADTLDRVKPLVTKKKTKQKRRERLEETRMLKLDSEMRSAIMTLNSFDGGYGLGKFFRQSFRTLRKKKIENLVIDIRSNGGGKVNNYTRLSRYVRNTPFKVADSAYAITRNFKSYGKYFQAHALNALALGLFTARRQDGNYHFNYWLDHTYKPKKKNFFSGNIYVLIGGPTFSASTLFAHTIQGQSNVTFIGEETGGGRYGNSGLMIPYMSLPNTGLRVRMPLFRLVQHNPGSKDGRGIIPDIYVGPTSAATLSYTDLKLQKAFELIRAQRHQASK